MGYLHHLLPKSNELANPSFESNPTAQWSVGTGWAWDSTNYRMSFDGSALTEILLNGTFTGSAASWTLGGRWAYGSNQVAHSAGGTSYDAANTLSQDISAVEGAFYIVRISISAFTSAGFLTADIGNASGNYNQANYHGYGFAVLATGTFYFLLRADGEDGVFRIKSANTGAFSIDDVSVMEASDLRQNLSFENSFAHVASLSATSTSPVGQVVIAFMDDNGRVYQGVNGSGFDDFSFSTDEGRFIIVASKDWTGVVSDASLTFKYEGAVEQAGIEIPDTTQYRVRLRVGGTQGTVTVAFTDGNSFLFSAGAGLVTGFTTMTGADLTITPSSNFNGTIDSVSVKKVLSSGFGPELVANGSFTGGSTNWTLTDGWVYQGESGGSLPDYNPSLASALVHFNQGLPFPTFVFAGVGGDESNQFMLFKKSSSYGFHIWRSRVYNIGMDFDVLGIKFPVIPGMSGSMQLTVKLYFDNEAKSAVSGVIDATTFPPDSVGVDQRLIKLNSKSFANSTHGKFNFFMELQITGSDLAVVALPITIELDVEDV